MPTIVNPTLPNILTNGTVADATQVMANFASMISQINSNAAENGSNSSITSLNGLTTPLSIGQGGTGNTSFGPQFALIVSQGPTTPLGFVSPSSTVGLPLVSNGSSSYPTFQALSTAAITGSLGYTPVQNGTGVGQAPGNQVKIGWNGANAVKVTVDSTDEGYMVLSSTNPTTTGVSLPVSLNAPSGLFDNSNRVWSPGNYQPLTVNGIGYDCLSPGTGSTEGNTYSLGGRPGTWLCLSSVAINGNTQLYRRIS